MKKTNPKKTFGEADQLSVTVLVDNKANLLATSSDTIRYFADEPLLAEHGFSLLFHLGDADSRILWDAGVSDAVLIENLHRMKIDPMSIHTIALSHGDFDHFGAMTNLLARMELNPKEKEWGASVPADVIDKWIKKHGISLITHPSAFRERWKIQEDGTKTGPIASPPKREWEAKGANLILSKEPYQLAEGCWTTGYVPRQSFEESGRPKNAYYRQKNEFFKDDIEDDQAIAINLKEKGLVILSGCAHSGIVNTINYAREISGVDKICAIIGGFHLIKATNEE